MKNRARWGRRATFTIGITLGFAYVFPFFLVFVNALKLKYDILANPLALPVSITWENFQQAYTKMEFFRSLTNSLIITFFSVSLLIISSSMLAYYLARTKSKPSKYIFLVLVASMIVPFQALMIPFISRFAPFVSINNRAALIFFYIGFGTALSTFLYRLVLTQETQTLPLSTYLFYGQYSIEYGQAMAGLALAVIPILAFYLVLQKQFISGIAAGAVK